MASLAADPPLDAPVVWTNSTAPATTPLTDSGMAMKLRRDADIPWWAVELLDLPSGSPEARVRYLCRYQRPRGGSTWNILADLVQHAEATVMQRSIDEWRELCRSDTNPETFEVGDIGRIIRDAALYSPRAFVAFADLRDEEGNPVVLKDFHLRMLRAMRQSASPAMIQAFWGAGKSFQSSEVVPLMDWAEWPGATEGRVYLDDDIMHKWTGRLMQIVEHNDALHALFPWIAKPERGDPCWKMWGTEGFGIKGNPVAERSFEGHTIGQSKTGFRYRGRAGIDDVVSLKEAATASIQERNLAYIRAVVLTMRQRLSEERRRRSRYGTVWAGVYTVGTPYDRVDVNVQLEAEYREKGWTVVRVPIFVGEDKRVRWPELMTAESVEVMRSEMGPQAFAMRCELKVGGEKTAIFPEDLVDWSLKDGRSDSERAKWCVVPEHTKLLIGYDPGSGRRPSHHGARYPAFTVYGLRDLISWRPQPASTAVLLRDGGFAPPPPDLEHHVIQWGRLEGMGAYAQCQKLAELARFYGCPIAVEDNGTQESYAEILARIAPDVKIICHSTYENKRDPVQGIDQFEPIVRNRRLVIHAAEAPADAVKALRDELVGWPTWGFCDIVMSLWIARHQFALHVQMTVPIRAQPVQQGVPGYVRRFQTGLPDRFTGTYGR